MLVPAAHATLTLDMSTLFVVATCVAGLLGMFMLFAWLQDRVRALAWWGSAYLIGGLSVAAWSIEGMISPPLPFGTANAMLFVSCGMIWSAARLFHGRPILWGAMAAGATAWLLACMSPDFLASTGARIGLSSIIVAAYTVLTSAELWRERRQQLLRRWPAICVPMLHGAIFLIPIPLSSILPADGGVVNLASGWIAIFALEVMLYVVGSAFIVLVLSKERIVRVHKAAALTDPMTGLFNRRGFIEASCELMTRQARQGEPVSVLMFDLDRFKSINDTYGHAIGDDALRLFGAVAAKNMRINDILARFGGEEFVAVLPGDINNAVLVAQRVRLAFEAAAVQVGEHRLNATVSVGIACGAATTDVEELMHEADEALYRAKTNGRNRVEKAGEADSVALPAPVPLAA